MWLVGPLVCMYLQCKVHACCMCTVFCACMCISISVAVHVCASTLTVHGCLSATPHWWYVLSNVTVIGSIAGMSQLPPWHSHLWQSFVLPFIPYSIANNVWYEYLTHMNRCTLVIFCHMFCCSLQSKYQEVESKYKDAMVTNAQLYTDKTQLVYHVESLKDKWVQGSEVQYCVDGSSVFVFTHVFRLEDQEQAMVEVKFELQREQSVWVRELLSGFMHNNTCTCNGVNEWKAH